MSRSFDKSAETLVVPNPTDNFSVGTTVSIKNDIRELFLSGKLRIRNNDYTDGGLLYSNAEAVETVPGIVYNRTKNKLIISGALEVAGGIKGAGGHANNMVVVDHTSNIVGISNVNYDFNTGKLKFSKGITIRG